jgi:hypothetical protein
VKVVVYRVEDQANPCSEAKADRKFAAEVDTSVVISRISAFKSSFEPGRNPSADILWEWVERGRFVWLVTPEVLEEYKEIAKRLNVRASVAGQL